MATLKISGTITFDKLWEAISSWKYKIIILKGGSRSGKTIAIIQALLLLLMKKKRRVTAWRKRRIWAKATIYHDTEHYLKTTGLYTKDDHNKSDLTFSINGGSFEFNGLDDAQKLHGLTQDIAWINEAIEANLNDLDQLEMRTNELVLIDLNPTEDESWVYDLEKRNDVLMIHSTFKDNAFLPDKVIRKILSYEPTPFNIKQCTANDYKWKVYGLGVAAKKEGLVFPRWEIIEEYPKETKTLGYGLDFGFYPDPAAFGKAGLFNGRLVLDEMLYETELNNIIIPGREELPSIQGRLQDLGISRRDDIIADSAAKSNINELKSVGYNITPVVKYAGSVTDGIELMNNYAPFYVTERSVNLIKELKNYMYKKNFATDTFLKEPIDDYNHLLDLFRYVAQTKLNKQKARGIQRISYKIQ
ncbi:MAG: PBSX family phage terminase large subunit [Dysgonamonadaceae bacterium]|jgi:phage terminase large subunit|nr:PBSX family phage terminase large subunit [Dysgonamonadaceae bacterium]